MAERCCIRSLIGAAYRLGGDVSLEGCNYGPVPYRADDPEGPLPYYRLLAGFAALLGPELVVEVGTYHGGSTLAFAAGMTAGPKQGRIVTIDPTRHEVPQLDAAKNIERITAAFPSEGVSDLARSLADRRIDILYVDALKDKSFVESVLEATQEWKPRLLVFDDIAANESMETAWRQLKATFGEAAVAVTEVLDGVRNIEFDLGIVVSDPELLEELAPRIAKTNGKAAFSDIRVGAPYDFALHDEYPDVRTMMTRNETGMLHRIARDRVSGIGQIVDAGAFLGASTVCFGKALSDRNVPSTLRIHSYDRFTNSDPYFDKFLRGVVPRYASFLPQFNENVSQFSHMVNVYEGNFSQIGWTGRPIELFFVDIAKSKALNSHLYEEFAKAWIPGHTIYVQQDFVHMEAPWIQYVIEYLFDCFSIIGVEHPSLYLGIVHCVPPEKLRRIANDDFAPMEKAELVSNLANRFSDVETVCTLRLISARLRFDAGDRKGAHAEIEACAENEHFAKMPRGRLRLGRARQVTGMTA